MWRPDALLITAGLAWLLVVLSGASFAFVCVFSAFFLFAIMRGAIGPLPLVYRVRHVAVTSCALWATALALPVVIITALAEGQSDEPGSLTLAYVAFGLEVLGIIVIVVAQVVVLGIAESIADSYRRASKVAPKSTPLDVAKAQEIGAALLAWRASALAFWACLTVLIALVMATAIRLAFEASFAPASWPGNDLPWRTNLIDLPFASQALVRAYEITLAAIWMALPALGIQRAVHWTLAARSLGGTELRPAVRERIEAGLPPQQIWPHLLAFVDDVAQYGETKVTLSEVHQYSPSIRTYGFTRRRVDLRVPMHWIDGRVPSEDIAAMLEHEAFHVNSLWHSLISNWLSAITFWSPAFPQLLRDTVTEEFAADQACTDKKSLAHALESEIHSEARPSAANGTDPPASDSQLPAFEPNTVTVNIFSVSAIFDIAYSHHSAYSHPLAAYRLARLHSEDPPVNRRD